MNTSVNTDDVIFNFFKQICDEKDDIKCVELGNSWINAMETNLNKMELNLNEKDKLKFKEDIQITEITLIVWRKKIPLNGESTQPNVWLKLWIIKCNFYLRGVLTDWD